MKNGGQITVFVVIGILVVVSVLLFFTFGNDLKDDSKDIGSLEANVDYCLNGVYEEALHEIGLTAGVYESTEIWTIPDARSLTLLYKQGEVVNEVSIDSVKKDLSMVVGDLVISCFVEDYDGRVSYDYENTDITIYEDRVKFVSNLIVNVNDGEEVKNLEFVNKNVDLDSDLKSMIDVASFIVNDVSSETEELCISCLNAFVADLDVKVDIVDSPNEEKYVIYFVTSTRETSAPLSFVFVNKYNWDSLNFTLGSAK